MPKCKAKTKFLPAAFAWCLLLTCTSLFFAYPGRWYFDGQHRWLVLVYQGLVTLFVVMNFSLATFMDPGVIPRAKSHEDKYDDFRAPLYKNVEINGITVRMKWCVTCQFYRPPRCSHCSVCNNCIEIFDHHCPWVNNCIGRRNYRYFFMFLISLSVHMTSIFVFSLIHVLKNKPEYDKPEVIVSIVLLCVIALLFIPIFGLTGFHMVLVSRGRTTNEQVTGKFRGGYNPFSKNCFFNCCNTLCGPQYPSLKHPTKYVGKKTRKYVIPAKPITPLHLRAQQQQQAAGQADQQAVASGGQGSGPQGGSEVQMYRETSSGGLHGTPYNKMTRQDVHDDGGSDMDEPMASQGHDSEAPLTHNTSKSNFFNMTAEGAGGGGGGQPDVSVVSRGGRGETPVGAKYRSSNDVPDGAGGYQSPLSKKVGKMGGIPTPLAGVVQSPNRFTTSTTPNSSGGIKHQQPVEYMQMKEHSHPASQPAYHSYPSQGYSGGQIPPATTAGPNSFEMAASGLRYQVKSPTKRYLSEGELLDNVNNAQGGGVGVSGSSDQLNSSSHLTGATGDAVSSPQRGNYYMWKPDPATSAGQEAHPSYATQVGYYLQQSQPRIPTTQQINPAQTVIQSGGPRTTPSGYPGGPIVPSGQPLSPPHHQTSNQRPVSHHGSGASAGYSTTGRMSVHQQPPTFTRALEMSKSMGQSLNHSGHSAESHQPPAGTEMHQVGGGSGQPVQQGQGEDGSRRDSVYDMNSYEISV